MLDSAQALSGRLKYFMAKLSYWGRKDCYAQNMFGDEVWIDKIDCYEDYIDEPKCDHMLLATSTTSKNEKVIIDP